MSQPLIMGILNVTPDSFSDGGQFRTTDLAIARGREMFELGVDIVDVGGESTRPGSLAVDLETELDRVLPVVSELSKYGTVSIDTQKSEVATKACSAGATIINDVSASLSTVAADLDAGWIAMHMHGTPDSMQQNPQYSDVVVEVRDHLVAQAQEARRLGIKEIWIDPGFGFGKTIEHNLALLANIEKFVATGFPVAVGISRKSMLGQVLAWSDGDIEPVGVDDRLVGSLISAAFAMISGVNLVRVHDVAETLRVRAVITRSC